MPIIYIIQGLNYIETDKASLKFFVDSIGSSKAKETVICTSDHKRTYELRISSVINMSKINPVLDRNGTNQFQLKIINEHTTYFVPFQRKQVDKS